MNGFPPGATFLAEARDLLQVVGHHQTVIKPLSPLHRGIFGLSGATILGDGRVALILDVAMLVQAAQDAAAQRLSA
jgi:two-component system chemotaxis sensor kinase CheA